MVGALLVETALELTVRLGLGLGAGAVVLAACATLPSLRRRGARRGRTGESVPVPCARRTPVPAPEDERGERIFRFVVEHLEDVVLVLELESKRLVYLSPSGRRLFPLPVETYLHQRLEVLFSEGAARSVDATLDALQVACQKGLAETAPRRLELFLDRGAERARVLEVYLSVHEKEDQGRSPRVLGVLRDITERKDAEAQVHQLAFMDALTGLPNRRLFVDRLTQELHRARRGNKKMALCFVDLDEFKPINDRLGHRMGDLVLVSVADRIRGCLRAVDTAARFGGDEFVLLLPDIARSEDALVVAERVRCALSRPIESGDGHQLRVSSSIGVALFPDHATDERSLLHVADQAMYHAKRGGRDCVFLLDPGRLVVQVPSSLEFEPAHFSGNALIDQEHRALFEGAARLFGLATLPNTDLERYHAECEKFIGLVRAHFEHEELVLVERGYPRLAEHQKLHRALLGKAEQLSRDAKESVITIGQLTGFVAEELIAAHLVNADRDYFPWCAASSSSPVQVPHHPAEETASWFNRATSSVVTPASSR